MKELKGSKTEKNLQDAFANESMASIRYSMFKTVAKYEGYKKVADFFDDAADEEFEHATLWYALLHGGDLPSTKENLQIAIDAENDEWTNSYTNMAKVAREEGFEKIAKYFDAIAEEEEGHEEELHELLNNLDSLKSKKHKCHCKDEKKCNSDDECECEKDKKCECDDCKSDTHNDDDNCHCGHHH